MTIENPANELREKIRQQFESEPYPSNPIDHTPEGHYLGLMMHAVATPYYLKYQTIPIAENLTILDAGCGTGYASLVLAKANPGAKIVGIDPSATSIQLAAERLRYHGINNASFHVGLIEDVPELGLQFDYINCDEVLYLLPDLSAALKALRSVLKPRGILRGNLNNKHQRAPHYRAQELFAKMGLMEDNPGEFEINLVVETLEALQPQVALRRETWPGLSQVDDYAREGVLLNYLLQGDRGYTIADLFGHLEAASFDFISMVNWRQWELLDLFADPEKLPMFWQMTLPEMTLPQRLETYELLNPVHRLMDFWAVADSSEAADRLQPKPISDWEEPDWQNAIVHLHPVLQTASLLTSVQKSVRERQPLNFGKIVPEPDKPSLVIDANQAALLLPLWESPQRIADLVERWLKIEPIDPISLEPRSKTAVWDQVTQLLTRLELLLYILLEQAA